jgi:2-hydroxy-3-oxopropionate reductase
MTRKLGFVGLGVMGRPMAQNLMRVGYAMHVYARRAASAAPLIEQGALACASPAELATCSDVVFVMVTAGVDVERVVLGAGGIVEGARPGLVVVDHSTIPPATARLIAAKLAEHGVDFLDAPVSGGERGAIDATLSIMVGGSEAAFRRVEPLLRCIGKTVLRIGEAGAGQVAKAANQLAIVLTLQGLAEALTLARSSGVDPAKVLSGLREGAAASRILEVMGPKMLSRDFRPGVEARLHHKDIRIVLECAAHAGVAVPGAALAAQSFSALMARGGARQDSSAVLTVVEAMACASPAEPSDPRYRYDQEPQLDKPTREAWG